MTGRKIPQNIEAEMECLGAAFLTEYALDKVCVELDESMFYLDSHKKIYQAIKNLYDKRIPLDITTVTNELEKLNFLNSVTIEYLAEVIDSVATAANIDYYINIVYEKSLLRKLIDASNTISASAYDENDEVGNIVDNAEKSIFDVSKNRKAGEFLKITDVIRKVQDRVESNAKNNKEITGLATGFYDLDRLTSGLHGSELIILAARPGMGKTAIGLNIATHASMNSDKAVAFFSLEMNAEQLVMRIISSIGGIDQSKLKTGKLANEDWIKFNEALSELSNSNLYLEDASGLTVSEIRAKCRRLANTQNGISLIVIDYLQLIQGSARYAGNRQQEVSEISRALKIMAMELNVPVIALAQLSRNPELREDKRPNLSDLRESGSIEQDADIVAFLYNDDYYNRNKEEKTNISISELIVGKHRNGSTDTIKLLFEKNLSNFRNYIEKTQ